MSLRHEATRRAVLKAILDAIAKELSDQKQQVLTGLLDARANFGMKSMDVTLPDGTKVATITLTEPAAAVTPDERAFLAWVRDKHPTELVETVRPAFRTAVMDRLVIDGGRVIDETTGEVVEWASVRTAPEPSNFSLRFTGPAGAAGRQAIAAAWATGQLDDYAPGPRAIEGNSA